MKPSPQSVVSTPLAKDFNENQKLCGFFIWLICGPEIVSIFISHKKTHDVIEVLMKNWVGVFGSIGSLKIDNGGELSSDKMKVIPTILNVQVYTTSRMDYMSESMLLLIWRQNERQKMV